VIAERGVPEFALHFATDSKYVSVAALIRHLREAFGDRLQKTIAVGRLQRCRGVHDNVQLAIGQLEHPLLPNFEGSGRAHKGKSLPTAFAAFRMFMHSSGGILEFRAEPRQPRRHFARRRDSTISTTEVPTSRRVTLLFHLSTTLRLGACGGHKSKNRRQLPAAEMGEG
jgi:hypothetical protein